MFRAFSHCSLRVWHLQFIRKSQLQADPIHLVMIILVHSSPTCSRSSQDAQFCSPRGWAPHQWQVLHYSTLAEILLGIWLVATPPVAKKFLEISRWMTLRKKQMHPPRRFQKTGKPTNSMVDFHGFSSKPCDWLPKGKASIGENTLDPYRFRGFSVIRWGSYPHWVMVNFHIQQCGDLQSSSLGIFDVDSFLHLFIV